jgi:alanine dehydrogenase
MISQNGTSKSATAYADVVVGAVLTPGERTPILVTREMMRAMKPRSVIIDVSIDQGGCAETSRPTMHDQPVYIEEGIIHYCVPNMPGVVARTATHAFVNAAMPYIGRSPTWVSRRQSRTTLRSRKGESIHTMVNLSTCRFFRGGDDGLD